jgi:catechol 2,3-dioxygenase-like lactoylglutathione lyase family enzyme
MTENSLGPLAQIARKVENLDRARTFFRDSLGLTELFAYPPLAFFALGDTRLMLSETSTRDPADILYFRVADITASHAALMARGIAFSHPPHHIHTHPDGTEEWMAFFTDDEDRPLGLASVQRPAVQAS